MFSILCIYFLNFLQRLAIIVLIVNYSVNYYVKNFTAPIYCQLSKFDPRVFVKMILSKSMFKKSAPIFRTQKDFKDRPSLNFRK